jgi:hypothetical protein
VHNATDIFSCELLMAAFAGQSVVAPSILNPSQA